MAFLKVNSGVAAMALVKLGKAAFSQWKIGLYSNNYSPTLTDTLANYAGFTPAIPLGLVDYTTWAGAVSGGVWIGVCNPLVFTLAAGNAGQIIYGYFLQDSTPQLLGAELYTAPYTIPGGGGLWSVALQDTFS